MTTQLSYMNLSDFDLRVEISKTRQEERELSLQLLYLLAELDARKLYVEDGYSSLFDFCVRKLGYSESGAYRRISTARCLSKFPQIATLLENGSVNSVTISLVSGICTAENVDELLRQIVGKSQKEVQVVVAKYKPVAEPVRETIRPVVVAAKSKDDVPQSLFAANKIPSTAAVLPLGESKEVIGRELCSVEMPETVAARFELRFSVSEDTKKNFQKVQMLLSSKYPRGVSIEQAFKELVDDYLNRRDRSERKGNERKVGTAQNSRFIPTSVRREVYRRDGGCCTYVSPDGVRCGSSWDVEMDHIVPFAAGGTNVPENLRLLCRRHNIHAAEKSFGKPFMEQFVA